MTEFCDISLIQSKMTEYLPVTTSWKTTETYQFSPQRRTVSQMSLPLDGWETFIC